MRNLIDHPLWQPAELGQPIPDSPHAVSVCLPTVRDHIGYEEQDPRVHDQLQAGYPRFVFNPLCRRLFDVCRERFAADGETCLVFSARPAADRFCEFLRTQTGETARVHDFGFHGVSAVSFPRLHENIAKDYWQHSGDGISSRHAAACLASLETSPTADVDPSGSAVKALLRDRIAGLVGVAQSDVRLFSCGMTGIFAVHRALQNLFPGRKTVQFGFPYVDTLKVQQKFGAGVHFFPRGDARELAELERLLEQEPVAGVFTEFPSNPLLLSPNLERLSDLTRRHGVPLIVDETLATFANVDLLPVADVITTSLTKFFSGIGDVTGGSIVLNPRSSLHTDLSREIDAQGEPDFWGEDARTLEKNSRDFTSRMHTINRNAEQLADMLKSHPRVADVFYPKFKCRDDYCASMRAGAGYGGLLSITLHDEAESVPRFFDALRICKGPNLGTNYSLACLYTILAHYRELEFAESCGVSRYLVRISVGLEQPDDLSRRFQQTLNCA